MEKWIKIIAASLIASIVICAAIFYFDEEFFLILVEEDGLIESITAFTLLLCWILLLARLIKQRSSRNRKWIVYNVLLVIVLFMGFGEEISWGQRIFQIESSDFFLKNNKQEEINFHNLQISGLSINRIIFSYFLPFVLAVYFLLSLFMYRRNSSIRNMVDSFGIHIPKIKHSLILAIISVQIFLLPNSEKWELWECLFPLIFLLIFLDPYNYKERIFPAK